MLRVRINYSGLTEGFSVWHFDPAEDDQTSADAAVNTAVTFLQAVDGFMKTTQTYQVDPEVLVVNETTGDTTGVFAVASSAGAGADTQDALPNAAQALVRWRTGVFFEGRERRGRTFIPGFTLGALEDNGNLTASAISTIQTAAAAVISTSEFGIWSPTLGGISQATTASVWSEFAVLRKRRD